jgi:hypothetical protein
LEEADQFERRADEPVTRQFQIEPEKGDATDSTVMEVKAESETTADAPKGKSKPGKLPAIPKAPMTGNSKDAASETLRKFFSGR